MIATGFCILAILFVVNAQFIPAPSPFVLRPTPVFIPFPQQTIRLQTPVPTPGPTVAPTPAPTPVPPNVIYKGVVGEFAGDATAVDGGLWPGSLVKFALENIATVYMRQTFLRMFAGGVECPVFPQRDVPLR